MVYFLYLLHTSLSTPVQQSNESVVGRKQSSVSEIGYRALAFTANEGEYTQQEHDVLDDTQTAMNDALEKTMEKTGISRSALVGASVGIAVLAIFLLMCCCCCCF